MIGNMERNVIELEVASIETPERAKRISFLLDSGVMISVVPSATLNSLGIRPYAEHVIHLPNGESVTRKKGVALFRVGNRVGGGDVLFGEDGDAELLGGLILGSLGLFLDPLSRQLRELPALLAKETRANQLSFLDALAQVPLALEASLRDLVARGPLDAGGTKITAAILLTLKARSDAQEAIKKLLNKTYAAGSSDFFVETVLFYIKAFLESHRLRLTASSERNLVARRGAVRPDISIWRDSNPVAVIECKTNLGWNREGWREDFEAREQAIHAEFPGVECFLVVLTNLNWPGFGDYPRIGTSAFTLSKSWPSEVNSNNVEAAILHPIEPLFRRLSAIGANR